MIAAVVPAAGRSTRMGRPKLLMPIKGMPLVVRVVVALRDGGADRIIVINPPADEPGATMLRIHVAGRGAEVVVPDHQPPDMRASIELGLKILETGQSEPSALLLTPGDIPGLTRDVVAQVIAASADSPGRIVVPRIGDRRGHPLLLPWPLAKEIPRLPIGVGVNALLVEHAAEIVEVPVDDPRLLDDLDTPDDYRRWK